MKNQDIFDDQDAGLSDTKFCQCNIVLASSIMLHLNSGALGYRLQVSYVVSGYLVHYSKFMIT